MTNPETSAKSSSVKRILVPTDFTNVVDYAMDHAMKLAHTMGAEVYLLHLVPDMDEQEVMQRRLSAEKERGRAINTTVPLKTMLRKGKVYEGIGDAARRLAPSRSSWVPMAARYAPLPGAALRVITKSDVPFIVVQERGLKVDGYRI